MMVMMMPMVMLMVLVMFMVSPRSGIGSRRKVKAHKRQQYKG